MNLELQQELLHAASLLTKAASQLEYAGVLEKEASATTSDLVARGVVQDDQREVYNTYFQQNPEKIASIRDAFKDFPTTSGSSVLGEVAGGGIANSASWDDFDRAVLG